MFYLWMSVRNRVIRNYCQDKLKGTMKGFLMMLAMVLNGWAMAQQVKPLQFREDVHDFGMVAENSTPVVHQFDFTNTTNRPVKILKVQASCGCTTPDWTQDPVLPGQSGFIQASFNPRGRPGYFNKSLTVTTDFDSNPIILQIKGQVSEGSTNATVENQFRIQKGNWRLKSSSFNLGKVYLKDEYAAKEFAVVNAGDNAITFFKIEGPAYINAEVLPKTLRPGERGKIIVSYNGKKKNAYGFQSDNIEIHTDDEQEPVKSFSVYATLEEFFPQLTTEQLASAPRLTIQESSIDMGRIRQQTTAVGQVTVMNNGKENLLIRSIQTNCSCVAASADKTTLKPGESAVVKISFNPKDRKGTQTKAVTIYSNDPQGSVQRITLTAYVEE